MVRSFAWCGWLLLLAACNVPAEARSTAPKERSSDLRTMSLAGTGAAEPDGFVCDYRTPPLQFLILTPAEIRVDGFETSENGLPLVFEFHSESGEPNPALEIQVWGEVAPSRVSRVVGLARGAGYRVYISRRSERGKAREEAAAMTGG